MANSYAVRRELLLASGSPRRRELLASLGVPFGVAPADIDETVRTGELPEAYVHRMALAKAKAGFEQAGGTAHTVLGSDTAVVLGDRIFGKPIDRDDALEMLLMLSGNTHRVMSAVALVADGRVAQRLSITEVEFRAIASTEAAAYWRTGEPADKAGGYGIQGLGALFVKALHGSYSGVVGLPLFETAELLGEFGFELIVNDG